MFSGPVGEVSATSILVRPVGDRQLLVYQLTLVAPEPVAMVVPVPTPVGAGDDAVRFIDLAGYPDLFADLRRAFATWTFGPGLSAHETPLPALPVHQVGSFVASFVPSPADFGRLDPRFRLAADVIRALPRYRDWGFVVFQLAGRPDPQTVHPMAFELTRRFPDRLFVPTTHVHDGRVPLTASFDHEIYLQGERDDDPWERALDDAGPEPFYELRTPPYALRWTGDVSLRARGVGLALADRATRIVLAGVRENVDTWFSPERGLDRPRRAGRPRPPTPRPRP